MKLLFSLLLFLLLLSNRMLLFDDENDTLKAVVDAEADWSSWRGLIRNETGAVAVVVVDDVRNCLTGAKAEAV
jgi:hypothetical protein